MKIHLVYNDPFILGFDQILASISEMYELKIISMGELYRACLNSENEEADQLRLHLISGKVIPDSIPNNLLISKLKENSNSIIRNYPHSLAQWSLLKSSFVGLKVEVEKLWYFQSINVIENIYKIKKYKLMAERHDPTFSHIMERTQKIKCINLECLKFLNYPEKLELREVEAHGIEGVNSSKSVSDAIRHISTI